MWTSILYIKTKRGKDAFIKGKVILDRLTKAFDERFAKQKEGNVTFGHVFAHGFKTTAAIIVIMVICTVISTTFLFPDIIEKIMEQSKVEMEKGGKLTDEQITQSMEMVKKFFIPFAIGGIILMFGIIGAIGSLIGAGVAKKNPNYTPLDQQ